jgi:hypothetical protein
VAQLRAQIFVRDRPAVPAHRDTLANRGAGTRATCHGNFVADCAADLLPPAQMANARAAMARLQARCCCASLESARLDRM